MNAKNQVVTLVGLLIVSVICPTIFLLRWRRKRLASPTSRESAPWRITRVLYGVCSALVLYMTAVILPIVLYGAVSDNRLHEAQAVQLSRDAIINEMCSIAVDLSQYYALPREYDGGNHSYDGYKLAGGASKTAEASYNVTPNAKEVVIRAESVRYTSSWVKAKVDSTGELRSWSYGGKFQ
jgi:hypothetical protein